MLSIELFATKIIATKFIRYRPDKSPMQRAFFKNSGEQFIAHTSRFLGKLYNFHNFVIIFSLI